MAEKVGVDEETVRKRFLRAKELGSLPAWRMMVNPKLIGREVAFLYLHFKNEEEKPQIIGQLTDLGEGTVTSSVD